MSGWRRPNPVFSPEYGAIREVLISARKEAGLSLRQLAANLEKSVSHCARIENGQRRVDALQLYKFARACSMDPVELFARITECVGAVEAASVDLAPDARRQLNGHAAL